MSMGCFGRGREPEPQRPHEFENPEEWSAHVIERFLGELRPSEPFLLITRTLSHDSSGRTLPATWVDNNYLVGVLGDKVPVVSHDVTEGAHWPQIRIATHRYVTHPDTYHEGRMVDYIEGPVLIPYNGFHYTPVTKGFVPPFDIGRSHNLFDKEVEAFSAACGIEAMEKLALEQSAWERDFLGWYVRSVLRLGLPIDDFGLREKKLAEYRDIIRDIRTQHRIHTTENYAKAAEPAKAQVMRLLALADTIGLSQVDDYIKIDGFRCQPSIVIEDFRKLYPPT